VNDRDRRLRFVLLVALGLLMPLLSLRAVWTVDANGIAYASRKLPEWDFANLWAGGVLANQGEAALMFDPATYRPWFLAHVGADGGDREWSYPPNILLLAAPLASMPLFAAYLVWSIGSLAVLGLVLRWGRVPWPITLATVLGPGTLTNLFFGQTGTLVAALLLGTLLLAERRRLAAGVMAGLISIKPHLGILVPICFLAAHSWKAIAAAAGTVLLTVLCASALFGWDIYPLYFAKAAPVMRAIMEAPFPQSYHANAITVFLTARAAGAGVALAYAIQAIAALAAAVAVWRMWRTPCDDPLLRVAATGCLSLLATPYGYSYDMVVFTFACAVMLERAEWKWRLPLFLCWVWPSFSAFSNAHLFPITPAIVIFAAIRTTVPLLRQRPAVAGSLPSA
jgi:hypothetical protein